LRNTLAITLKTFSEIAEKFLALCQEQLGRGKQRQQTRRGLTADVVHKQHWHQRTCR